MGTSLYLPALANYRQKPSGDHLLTPVIWKGWNKWMRTSIREMEWKKSSSFREEHMNFLFQPSSTWCSWSLTGCSKGGNTYLQHDCKQRWMNKRAVPDACRHSRLSSLGRHWAAIHGIGHLNEAAFGIWPTAFLAKLKSSDGSLGYLAHLKSPMTVLVEVLTQTSSRSSRIAATARAILRSGGSARQTICANTSAATRPPVGDYRTAQPHQAPCSNLISKHSCTAICSLPPYPFTPGRSISLRSFLPGEIQYFPDAAATLSVLYHKEHTTELSWGAFFYAPSGRNKIFKSIYNCFKTTSSGIPLITQI